MGKFEVIIGERTKAETSGERKAKKERYIRKLGGLDLNDIIEYTADDGSTRRGTINWSAEFIKTFCEPYLEIRIDNGTIINGELTETPENISIFKITRVIHRGAKASSQWTKKEIPLSTEPRLTGLDMIPPRTAPVVQIMRARNATRNLVRTNSTNINPETGGTVYDFRRK